METAPTVLGLDIGTSGAKGLLVDGHGTILARAMAEYPLATPRPGWTEQDPELWWQGACSVLRSLMQGAATPPVALGLTGQMHGATFLDGAGQVIRPALLWNDQRTAAQCAQIESRLGRERLRAITGNPALTGFQAPKILWLREEEPEAFQRMAHVLLPKDFIRARLTGTLATDASDAAGTLLLDLGARDWSDEVLTALDIPRSVLPEVFEGPQVTGTVSPEGAKASGLPEGLPVVAGGGDNAAGAVGCGVVREGPGLVSIGTSGVVFVHSDTACIDPTGALHAFCHAVPGAYHLTAAVLSAGGSLRWYLDQVAPEEAVRAAQSSRDPYGLLLEEASDVPPGADGLFFLPYLSGERTPHMDPCARAAWLGLTLAHSRRHMFRALVEGVGFALRESLEFFAALEALPDWLYAVGGGSRSDSWLRLLAAQLGLPLQRLEVDEGPAFGAAILATVGGGVFADVREAVDLLVRPKGSPVAPDPALHARYEEIAIDFRKFYPALRDTGIWRA